MPRRTSWRRSRTTVATVNDVEQKQELVTQWQELTVRSTTQDPTRRCRRGAPLPVLPDCRPSSLRARPRRQPRRRDEQLDVVIVGDQQLGRPRRRRPRPRRAHRPRRLRRARRRRRRHRPRRSRRPTTADAAAETRAGRPEPPPAPTTTTTEAAGDEPARGTEAGGTCACARAAGTAEARRPCAGACARARPRTRGRRLHQWRRAAPGLAPPQRAAAVFEPPTTTIPPIPAQKTTADGGD